MKDFAALPTEPMWHAALRRLRQPEISHEQKVEDFAVVKEFFDGMATADVMRELPQDFLPTYVNLMCFPPSSTNWVTLRLWCVMAVTRERSVSRSI